MGLQSSTHEETGPHQLARGCALFSAGHTFSHFFITPEEFEENFYYSLLLQPQVAIPDNAILTGDYALKLLKNPNARGWLERGLSNDWVRPFFRHGGRFVEALDAMRREGNHRAIRDGIDLYAKVLDDAGYQAHSWPDRETYFLSHELEKTVRIQLGELPDSPSSPVSPFVSDFLCRSRKWRTEWIREATSREDGLMLTHLLDVAREQVLPSAPAASVTTPAELLNLYSKPDRGNLEFFFKLLCRAYNENMRAAFGTGLNLTHYDHHERELATQVTQGVAVPARQGDEIEFVGELSLPVGAALRNIPATDFATIRESGSPYFVALREALSSPSRANIAVCGQALIEYAAYVCEYVTDRATEKLDVFLTTAAFPFATSIAAGTAALLLPAEYEMLRVFGGATATVSAGLFLTKFAPSRTHNLVPVSIDSEGVSVHDLTLPVRIHPARAAPDA